MFSSDHIFQNSSTIFKGDNFIAFSDLNSCMIGTKFGITRIKYRELTKISAQWRQDYVLHM